MKDDERFVEWVYPDIEDGVPTKYCWIVKNLINFKLGYKTDIGAFTYINALNGVTIEDFAQVGSHCSIYSISTIDKKEGPVILKRNSKIGSHSVIMPNVVIGENAVVGAFSFVNQSIPANSVAIGVPAIIKKNISI